MKRLSLRARREAARIERAQRAQQAALDARILQAEAVLPEHGTHVIAPARDTTLWVPAPWGGFDKVR